MKLLLLIVIAGFSVSHLGCARPSQPVTTPPAAEAKDKPADAPPAEAPAPAEGKTP